MKRLHLPNLVGSTCASRDAHLSIGSHNRFMSVVESHESTVRDATLTVATVARRLGVSPTTLRTWDRRHGLGPSEHQAGTHRRYSATDLARLELMRRLTLEGVSAGEAARIALATEQGELPQVSFESPADAGSGPRPTVVPLARAEDKVRGLVKAADGLDSHAVSAIVAGFVARRHRPGCKGSRGGAYCGQKPANFVTFAPLFGGLDGFRRRGGKQAKRETGWVPCHAFRHRLRQTRAGPYRS